MNVFLYQKIYFTETHIQYPILALNEIVLILIDKYDIEYIKYTPIDLNQIIEKNILIIKIFMKDLII